ncbi:MAG: acylneuraminate cytidylyltransferase [Chloroflexi bacterium]|nr:acylneuraminate cytidylyltransferase [Chloroflexota bacterium]BCY16215.1 transferase [Leptolinea sp. HRD-7]
MVKKPEVLAIVPARGGSKGIPRKNIKEFAGYPLISYSIAAGLHAETVTRTILSTDDEEIAAVARQWGAETPFLRPAELASDQALDLPVYQHALQWLEEHEGYKPDVVVQLRPTSPVRPVDCVDNAVKMLLANPDADCVRGVVPAGQNPHKMWRRDDASGQLTPLLQVPGIAEPFNAPRQILPPVYWQTGHIDAIRPDTILKKNSMTGDKILGMVIDPQYTIDIDTPKDWARSEWLVWHGGLTYVDPAKKPRRGMPEKIDLMVFDFDGVITDNRVWVDENGFERVAANRSDSLGIRYLKEAGLEMMVLSMEVNKVVAARAKKMGIPALHGINDKVTTLRNLLNDRQIPAENVIYVGNDTNDLDCFRLVGYAVAVGDAQPEVKRAADLVLSQNGGRGAVREICDIILQKLKQ